MRNLVLVADSVIVLDNVNISATAVDLDENVIYAVSEKQNFDGDVDVELWKFGKIESSELIGVCYTSVLKHKMHLYIGPGTFTYRNVLDCRFFSGTQNRTSDSAEGHRRNKAYCRHYSRRRHHHHIARGYRTFGVFSLLLTLKP